MRAEGSVRREPHEGEWGPSVPRAVKERAQRVTQRWVRLGLRPRPNDLPCADCGRVWSGGADHTYDHHLGYAREHWHEVEPVCSTCHAARGKRRGERR